VLPAAGRPFRIVRELPAVVMAGHARYFALKNPGSGRV
jgi:hypothetical protein